MRLTRSWQATHKGSRIEVQWTGTRFKDGWILRLLVDGQVRAEQKVRKNVALETQVAGNSVSVLFEQRVFHNRCTIYAAGNQLIRSSQPWNVLGLLVSAGAVALGGLCVSAVAALLK